MMLHLSFGARTIPILDMPSCVGLCVGSVDSFFSIRRRRCTKRVHEPRLLRFYGGEVRGVIKGLRPPWNKPKPDRQKRKKIWLASELLWKELRIGCVYR